MRTCELAKRNRVSIRSPSARPLGKLAEVSIIRIRARQKRSLGAHDRQEGVENARPYEKQR